MILDSSAIVAVVLAQPGYERALSAIKAALAIGVGAPTLVETTMVLTSRLGRDATPDVRDFLRAAEVEIIGFQENHWEAAVWAFLRYGKGRHRAGLNFGDCLSYAVASVAGDSLLFVGNGFDKTDILRA